MVKSLDLMIVNPGNRRQVYQHLGSSLAAIETPVWAGMLASYVWRQGFGVSIIDMNAENLSPEDVAERLDHEKPTLTAIVVYGHQPSASTQNMPAASALATVLRQQCPELITIMMGGHVAALPIRTLQEEDVDFTCRGEGFHTLTALIQVLRDGREEEMPKVPDLCHRIDHSVASTAPAPLLRNPSQDIPNQAFDLLDMSLYRAHNWHCFGGIERQPYAALYTTLGCPYRCTFCCIHAPFKSGERQAGYKEATNSYRFWSPDSVLSQIDNLVHTYGVRNIKFADEMFVLNTRHVEAICNGIVERGYDLNIWAYARVDSVKPEIVPLMKHAGINWLAFGIESALGHVRDGVQKGFDDQVARETLDRVRSFGINLCGNYIFGLPDDDFDSMELTVGLALDLNCEWTNLYCAMAYPGSALYDEAVRKGWPLPDSWIGYSQHSVETLPLRTNHLTGAQVLAFRDRAFQRVFGSSRYLSMIERKFGEDTATHIKGMAAYRLERQHLPSTRRDDNGNAG